MWQSPRGGELLITDSDITIETEFAPLLSEQEVCLDFNVIAETHCQVPQTPPRYKVV